MSETELKDAYIVGELRHIVATGEGDMLWINRHHAAALLSAIDAPAPQWQPIETAPKDGRPLLLDHPGWHTRVLRGGWDAHDLAWRVHGFGCPATQPSKWQPLPAPPEVEG
ncbi:hypothetical protein ACS9ZL_08460 [Stenotrophomonas africana]